MAPGEAGICVNSLDCEGSRRYNKEQLDRSQGRKVVVELQGIGSIGHRTGSQCRFEKSSPMCEQAGASVVRSLRTASTARATPRGWIHARPFSRHRQKQNPRGTHTRRHATSLSAFRNCRIRRHERVMIGPGRPYIGPLPASGTRTSKIWSRMTGAMWPSWQRCCVSRTDWTRHRPVG